LISQAGKSDQVDASQKVALYNSMREASLRLTQEANNVQQPPMKYTVSGSPEPILQQLLRMAVKLSMDGLVEASKCMAVLERVSRDRQLAYDGPPTTDVPFCALLVPNQTIHGVHKEVQ
jgi:hypothetical protein